MSHAWFELNIDVPKTHTDAVASFLFDCGSAGVEERESAHACRLRAYFDGEPPIDALRQFCADAIAPSYLNDHGNIEVLRIEEKDWSQSWRAGLEPVAVGEKLWVCPTWNAAPPPGRIAVVVDPGMAFGTGQHPSTRGCLSLLEKAFRAGETKRALDVGTGSGILAIALAKLGAAEIVAIDTDPTALVAAADNAKRNAVSERIRLADSLDVVGGEQFDVLVANLFANLLQRLAPRLRTHVADSGTLVCSGFLDEDETRVTQAFTVLGLRPCNRYVEQGWVTLAFRAPT